MSDERKYSLRDMVLAQRQAFEDGAVCWGGIHHVFGSGQVSLTHIQADARRKYELPRITRPRVVPIPGSYSVARYFNGRLEWKLRDSLDTQPWDALDGLWPVTPEFVRVLYDLLDNPTEECDVE